MAAIENLITENMDAWTSAIKKRASQGRGSSKKQELYGIQKLRELILELAVRGLLVPQSINEGCGSDLIDQVYKEKEAWLQAGRIKKIKKFSPLNSEAIEQINLPKSWAVTQLGNLFEVVYGKGLPNSKLTEFGFKVFGANGIIGNYSSYLYEEPQLLISCRGAYSGKPNISPEKCFVTSNSLVLQNEWKHLDQKFFYYALTIVDKSKIVTGSAQPQVTTTNLEPFLVQVPPLAEQKRIVAKVDELMLLCEQLEEQQENSLAAHQQLVEALLTALTQATNAEAFQQAWARLAANFETLFTTENSIDQLKQTLLQLAVMGKLVPQDPNDEPASLLLEKIAAEKEKLIKEGKIKKQKPLPEISEAEKPFLLPSGWEYVRFLELSNEVATGPFGSMVHKSDYMLGGVPLINPSHMQNSKIIEDEKISVSIRKAQELSSYRLTTGDIVMARRGEMGRAALVTAREDGWLCGTGSFILRFNKVVFREYILLLFKTEWVCKYLGGKSIGTTMTNLNHSILNKLPLLLPPIAEQKRIVAKVDQLFAICDQLKEKIRTAEETQLQLADALTSQAIQ